MIKSLIVGSIILSFTTSIQAFDNGQYKDVPPEISNWFKSVRSSKGIPCCDVSDGHYTTWRKSEIEGYEYEVPIEGEWVLVPPEAIVKNAAPNPTGQSVVWYVPNYIGKEKIGYHIRCFTLGPGS